MNPPPAEWDTDPSPFGRREDIDVVLFPSHADLESCKKPGFTLGAQNARPTKALQPGEVSMQMIKDLGCTYVLCGHSDRRKAGETDSDIATQVSAAINAGLIPILCVGETADERSAGQAKNVIEKQLQSVLSSILLTPYSLLIAYEPIWAIGTGNTATPEDAEEMHAFIRSLLPKKEADGIRILYGGSVKKSNAQALIAQPDIDGFLVGGASLDPQEFGAIVDIAGTAA